MLKFTFNLLAAILFCFGSISCGGGKGGDGSGGNSRMMNGNIDTSDPTVPWTIAVLKPYSDGAGQTRHRNVSQDVTHLYHGILSQINIEENEYTDHHSFQILNAVHDVQDGETGEFEGGIETNFGGSFGRDLVFTNYRDLDGNNFVYASIETSLGIVQLPNNDLITVGVDNFGRFPVGELTYRGINVIGRFGTEDTLEVGGFELAVNLAHNAAELYLDVGTVENVVTGTLSINAMRGTFEGSNLMWNYGTNMSGTATINGSFHGASGNAVSGVYSDNNNEEPRIFGAIAGTQQQ